MPAPRNIDGYFFSERTYLSPKGCWIWKGALAAGYGSVRVNYRHTYAHHLAYELFVGKIPQGLLVRHLCDIRCCVNPKHLELGTYRDNLLDRYHGTQRRR